MEIKKTREGRTARVEVMENRVLSVPEGCDSLVERCLTASDWFKVNLVRVVRDVTVVD